METRITIELRKGTRSDAMWAAAGSNREFDEAGVRRTNADKRRAVRLAWEASGRTGSTRKIADWVSVHETL